MDSSQFSYDKQFWTWTDNASTALEAIRIRNYIRHFSDRIHLTTIRDPLTGLYNRRGFEEFSSEFFENSIKNSEKFFLLAFEITNLKSINKKLGYNHGDIVTISIADAVNSSCRGNEICCRYGENRFYIIGSMNYTREAVLSHISTINRYCKSNITETEICLEHSFFCDKINESISLGDIIQQINNDIEKKKSENMKKSGYIKSFIQLRNQIYGQPQNKWNIDDMTQMMLLSRA